MQIVGRKKRMLCGKAWKVGSNTALGIGALLGAHAALAIIDFDARSPHENTVFTYSKEYLKRSNSAPHGFYPIGEFSGTNLLTRAELGGARWIVLGGEIWIRYDVNAHLAFRGSAPRLFSSKPDPDDATRFVDLLEGGAVAFNATTFAEDGFLLFRYDPPENLRPVTESTTVELDLKEVLATSGNGDGVLRVRAFADLIDAIRGEGEASGLDKRHTVVRVANSVRVVPLRMTRRARALTGFRQFALGSRVPLGGFQIAIDTEHRQPDGLAVGTTLEELNVAVGASATSFTGAGAFAFAPADGGWTLEQLDPDTGLCHGDNEAAIGDPDADPPLEPDPTRTVHPVDFGPDDANYPAGPATGIVPLGAWYLCATVSDDNEEIIQAADYYLTVTLAAADDTRPFPAVGVSDAHTGTISRDGTTVHIPYLTTSDRSAQRLIIVNRHRRQVDYVLIMHPWAGGTADPKVIQGKVAGRGPTALEVADVTTLSGTGGASATLAIVSFPDKIDVATTSTNPLDGSTDTVVLHRGLHDPETIAQDGTTVHIPYLTTAAGYAQRLTIVNRHRRAVPYVLTVHPEEGGTAEPPVIEGMVQGPGPTTIRIADVTALSGTQRASATLEIVSLPDRIDVATTLVNKADGSTDTVILHRGASDR